MLVSCCFLSQVVNVVRASPVLGDQGVQIASNSIQVNVTGCDGNTASSPPQSTKAPPATSTPVNQNTSNSQLPVTTPSPAPNQDIITPSNPLKDLFGLLPFWLNQILGPPPSSPSPINTYDPTVSPPYYPPAALVYPPGTPNYSPVYPPSTPYYSPVYPPGTPYYSPIYPPTTPVYPPSTPVLPPAPYPPVQGPVVYQYQYEYDTGAPTTTGRRRLKWQQRRRLLSLPPQSLIPTTQQEETQVALQQHTITAHSGSDHDVEANSMLANNSSHSARMLLAAPSSLRQLLTISGVQTIQPVSYRWNVSMQLSPTSLYVPVTGSASSQYVVKYTRLPAVKLSTQVQGSVTVNNGMGSSSLKLAQVQVQLLKSNGAVFTLAVANCPVTDARSITVPAKGSVRCSFSATYAGGPSGSIVATAVGANGQVVSSKTTGFKVQNPRQVMYGACAIISDTFQSKFDHPEVLAPTSAPSSGSKAPDVGKGQLLCRSASYVYTSKVGPLAGASCKTFKVCLCTNTQEHVCFQCCFRMSSYVYCCHILSLRLYYGITDNANCGLTAAHPPCCCCYHRWSTLHAQRQ